MTICELKESQSKFVRAVDIAPILGVDPQSIRSQAQTDPSKLGFKVSVIGRRILIPREQFIMWLDGEK